MSDRSPDRTAAQSYFVTTPYIDAYEHDWEPEKPKIDLAAFAKKLEAQAADWGENGIGRAYLNGNEPPMYDGRYVLAIGIFGSDEKWIAVQRERGTWRVEIVKADWPVEWDVT